MTTYIWKINTLERETSDGFVFTAHWSVTAISDVLDPEGNPHNAGAYGSIGLERPDNLIPYEDLTEDLVIGWVQEKLGGADKVKQIENALDARKQIENALDARIAEQINPSKINGVPWGN
jgi:hypothetical protein